MPRRLPLLVFALMTTAGLCCVAFQVCLAQSVAGTDAVNEGAVVAKAPTLNYPAIANMAHITGDVALIVSVRSDGSVESVTVRSGPPLLQQAAVDNARASQFDCHGCDQPVTRYSLVYTFELSDTGVCPDEQSPGGRGQGKSYPQVTRSPGHVKIVAQLVLICDPAAVGRRVRSAKCLWLWRCGVRYSTADDESKKATQ